MSNRKLYKNLLKFKDFDNKSYEVDVKNDDLVIDVKKRLSLKIMKYYKNIILMFNNKLLFDDKLINDYEIGLNKFVLWFEGYNCVRFCNTDSDIIKCITIINMHNDDEYFINMNKHLTIGNLKSEISKKYGLYKKRFYLKFNETNLTYFGNATLEKRGLKNGCVIYLMKVNSLDLRMENYSSYLDDGHQRCEMICTMKVVVQDLSLIPLTHGCEFFKTQFIFDMNDLLVKICYKNGHHNQTIESSFIKLYFDDDKINQIKSNLDLRDLYENYHIDNNFKIYYEIYSKLEELEKLDKLGKGSFGKVYKYKDKNTNEIFAMKIFDFSTDSLIKENYQREIDCYLQLKSHHRIIKYEKHFIEKHKSYILMEYMRRGSLGKFVRNNDLLPEYKIARYARQILEGLEYLHSNKILHRDLKGDNILLDENYDLKLCDFGLAKILTDISSGDFLNGVVQSTVGTNNWMSPEIINNEECGPASDIWSFGATMVEIITRKNPYDGLGIGIIVPKILAGELEFEYPAHSTSFLKSFISSCLKRNPKERPMIKDLYQDCFIINSL